MLRCWIERAWRAAGRSIPSALAWLLTPALACRCKCALGRSPLLVEVLVSRRRAIQLDALEPAQLEIDVLFAARPFGKLWMVTSLPGWMGVQERTVQFLGAKAVGILEETGGVQAQVMRAEGEE